MIRRLPVPSVVTAAGTAGVIARVIASVIATVAASSGCNILGLVDPVFSCVDAADCGDDEACVTGLCVAEGEGEGTGEGEGEGEGGGEGEGEGEGEGNAITVFGLVDPVADRDLVAGVDAADGVVEAAVFVVSAQDEPTPVVGRFATSAPAQVAINNGLASDIALELFFRAPSVAVGQVVVVDALDDGGNGIFIAVDGGLVVDVGQWEMVWPLAAGAWHHLLCVGRDGADAVVGVGGGDGVEVRCVLDGVEVAAVPLLDGTTVAGPASASLLPGSSDAAVASLRIWSFQNAAAVDLVGGFDGGALIAIEQTRLHRSLGVAGLLPRAFSVDDLGDGVAYDGKIVLNVAAAQLVAPTWPRIEPAGLLLEPPRTQLIDTTCVDGTFFIFGLDSCDVGPASSVLVDGVPPGLSTLTFFSSSEDVFVEVGNEPVACTFANGFVVCELTGALEQAEIRATSLTTVQAVNLDTGPVTTRPSPTSGRSRPTDRQDVAWDDDDLLLIATLVLGDGPVDFWNVVAADADGGAACSVDVDCDANQLCDQGECKRRREIGRLTFNGTNIVFQGPGTSTQRVPLTPDDSVGFVILRRINAFTCPPEAGLSCAAIDAPGAARLEVGADAARDADTGRGFLLRLSVVR